MRSEDVFGMDLSDGTSLRLLAADQRAVPVVELLAGAMALRPSSGKGRMLLAAVRGGRARDASYGPADQVYLSICHLVDENALPRLP